MTPRLLAAALLGALLLLTPAAQARTTTAKAITYAGIDCYATIPLEGRGIVCSSDSLPDTGGLDPFVSLKPTGPSKLGQRGDYGGYDVRHPARLKLHDRWVWHGITCTAGKDGMTCLNRQQKGFNIGPTGYRPL